MENREIASRLDTIAQLAEMVPDLIDGIVGEWDNESSGDAKKLALATSRHAVSELRALQAELEA